jgi:pyrroline-5-carboxylate reductase
MSESRIAEKIAFIGGGQMAEALIARRIRSGLRIRWPRDAIH